ncbi:hypothetical protein C8Q79DRAFT_981487 [Trametes meyenii]|nr:hypothetical protein C8Q79DRAFT_981487 [Trametes meyenii]
MFPLLSLLTELVSSILDDCDLLVLLTLRTTCKSMYDHVLNTLQHERRTMAELYVGDSEALWDILEETHAVVGGPFVTAFLLHDHSVPCPTLDVFVSSTEHERLEQLLEEHEHLGLEWHSTVERDLDDGHVTLRARSPPPA